MASEHLATAFLKEVADISRLLEAINLPQGQEVVGKSDFDLCPKIIGLITINRPYTGVQGRDAELNRLLPAIENVYRHYADTITIATLARLCSLSQSQFMRVFRQGMNMTAQAFVEQFRMFHAIDAIKHTTHSIARIALDNGFYDHSAFVKRFRKFTGTTPLQYRREQQTTLKADRAIALPKVK